MTEKPQTPGGAQALDLKRPYEVMRYVFEICKWPPNAKLAYLILYRHRNVRTGTAKVEYRTLADEMVVTPKVAVAAIKSLESAGAVKVARKQRVGRHQDANEYTVVPPWEARATAERIPSWKRKPGKESDSVSVPTGKPDGEVRESLGKSGGQSQGKPVPGTPGRAVEQAAVATQSVLPIDESVFPSGHVTGLGLKNTTGFISPTDPAGAVGVGKRTRTSSSKEKTENPYGSAAVALVRKFNEWHEAQTGAGLPKDSWPGAVRMVKDALSGRGGKGAIPVDEADAALTDALADPAWRADLLAYGIGLLRKIWAKSKGVGTTQGRRGKYVDLHAGGATYDENSGFRERGREA